MFLNHFKLADHPFREAPAARLAAGRRPIRTGPGPPGILQTPVGVRARRRPDRRRQDFASRPFQGKHAQESLPNGLPASQRHDSDRLSAADSRAAGRTAPNGKGPPLSTDHRQGGKQRSQNRPDLRRGPPHLPPVSDRSEAAGSFARDGLGGVENPSERAGIAAGDPEALGAGRS